MKTKERNKKKERREEKGKEKKKKGKKERRACGTHAVCDCGSSRYSSSWYSERAPPRPGIIKMIVYFDKVDLM